MNTWRVAGCCTAWLLAAAVAALFNHGAHRKDHLCKPELYPMYCAWCAADGREYIVGWSPAAGSSGICERHAAEWAAEAGIG